MITFGRFSDSFKPKQKIEAWNTSERLFLAKDYMGSYEAFMNYLRDDDTGNVNFKHSGEGGGSIEFEFQQGSKIIKGKISGERVTAESEIAEFDKPSIAFMRRLMEMNYTLFYSRFALTENKICIKFDSSVEAAPPRKLYFGFKELATRADKQDDLLIDDFSMLRTIGNAHIEQISESEKDIMYGYYRKWLSGAISSINGLNEDAFSGGISYLLLNTAYKTDYLISPEGSLMHEIEKMSWEYFAKDNKPFVEKNRKMKESLQKILDLPKEKVTEDFYRVKSTFGIANPAQHQTVTDLFKSNLNNVKWYIENNHTDIAVTIYEYLATYSLFSYGLPRPDIKLFDLMLNIINQDYYTAMKTGNNYYDPGSGKFDEELIGKNINEITCTGLELYPELKFNTENLKFDTLTGFLRSFAAEMQDLNYSS